MPDLTNVASEPVSNNALVTVAALRTVSSPSINESMELSIG